MKLFLTPSNGSTSFLRYGINKATYDKISADNNKLLNDYENYLDKPTFYKSEKKGIINYEEYLVDKNGKRTLHKHFLDLQPADILLTHSAYSLGYRHGHSGLVIDNVKTLEALTIGEKTSFSYTDKWRYYPLVMVLRLKKQYQFNDYQHKITEYAINNLKDLNYSFWNNLKKYNNLEVPNGVYCTSLVWYAYRQFNIDINENSSVFVTIDSIMRSKYLEIVQIMGYKNLNYLGLY